MFPTPHLQTQREEDKTNERVLLLYFRKHSCGFIISLPLWSTSKIKKYRSPPRFCRQSAYSSNELYISTIQCAYLLFIAKLLWKLCAILLSLASEDAPVFYTVRKSYVLLGCVRVSEYSRCIILTNVRGAVGCGQVWAGLPGLGFETSLTGRAVLSGGVVLAVALKGPVTEGALTSVEVTLAPMKTGNSGQLARLLHRSHRQGRKLHRRGRFPPFIS